MMGAALPCALLCVWLGAVRAQIAYTGHLSELRIRELNETALRMNYSINPDKYACDSYFDYVCSRNRPLFSVMGHMPQMRDLIQLLSKLQDDKEQFEAKHKMIDFFISCNTLKSVQDCYRETFEYFKPLFGYIISKDLVEGSSHELADFLGLISRFLERSVFIIGAHPVRDKLKAYKEKFRTPSIYFYAGDLNREYSALRIYRESYEHNLRNLEQHRKRNSSYEVGVQRTMLDWSLYLYQSRNKPMSYYYPTFTVHLYMTMFNITERQRDLTRFRDQLECLKLPPYVNVLDEALMLAVIYLKSFKNAWQEYSEWISSSTTNHETYNQEDRILAHHHLSNKRIFFTLYAQNFCEFGKELAEHVFYLGLKHNDDFFSTYSCGYQTTIAANCV